MLYVGEKNLQQQQQQKEQTKPNQTKSQNPAIPYRN